MRQSLIYDVNEMTFFFVGNGTVEIGQDERANEGPLGDLPGRRRARRSCAFECALLDLCEGESLAVRDLSAIRKDVGRVREGMYRVLKTPRRIETKAS